MTSRATLVFLFTICSLLSSCASPYGKASFSDAPQILNVSAYDPKERQRSGSGYTPLDQSALKRNGALGMIARCGKGMQPDSKCADFLVGAERQNMRLGAYYFVRANVSATRQADHFVAILRGIKARRGLKTPRILLVGDIDTKCTPSQIIAFIDRVEALTGVVPVIYLENSKDLIARLSSATASQKRQIRRAPYWLALYSNYNAAQPHIKTPEDLTKAYDVWDTWAMWQYGGVLWENRRSAPKVYRTAGWPAPKYFGDIDRPMERNAFNGSLSELNDFWEKHSWKW